MNYNMHIHILSREEKEMHNKENTKEAEGILERIISEMNRQNKKYVELIEFLDLPRGTFSSWKAGRSRNFCEHLSAIAKFLDVSVEYLVNGSVGENRIENSREQELLNCYRRISTQKQEMIRKRSIFIRIIINSTL